MRGSVYLNRTEAPESPYGYVTTKSHNRADSHRVPMTSSMFWKSPYTGESNISSVLRTRPIIKPTLNISTQNNDSVNTYTDTSPRLTVKSILKHSRGNESVETTPREEFTTRTKPDCQPNLITTGTGKGKPHGSPVRAKTASTIKRVQFSNKGQTVSNDRTLLSVLSPNPYKGRRLYLDRQTSSRILGDTSKIGARIQNKSSARNLNITLNSDEASIKAQIQSFIKNLRVAENDKVTMIETETGKETNAQQKTATKLRLRKSQSFSGTTMLQDWSEYDLEKLKTKSENEENQSIAQKSANENSVSNAFETKSRSDSDSFSIESFSSINEDSVFERSPGGAKIFRPKPNASLYTKYRHITTNDVNKYGIDYNESRDNKQNKNFCDKRKTNQILGWLDGVRNAQNQNNVEIISKSTNC
ncbi:hypothetical protein ACF0H5_009729 [Mactra antiquata]